MVNSKIYLNVPYAEKDAAKALGAKWDPTKKKWHVPADTDLNSFSKWQAKSTPLVSKIKKTKSDALINNPLPGVTTYPNDKDFVAYSGELPPWD